MKRALCMALALLLATLAAMPSLAQKRLPAPVMYRDMAEWWQVRGTSDFDVYVGASELRSSYIVSENGKSVRKNVRLWCIIWWFADKNGWTKSAEAHKKVNVKPGDYTWRILVRRSNKNKPVKYLPDIPHPSRKEMWGKSGWQTPSSFDWPWGGPDYKYEWCGLDGSQKLETRIQLIDKHGNPAGKKSKVVKLKLSKLTEPTIWFTEL
ncbi:MAG: hypothetical protein OXN88_05080 [Chloroflexota bacterium]|nr:hypothetical protein [Chloroflexota bacterium]